MNVQHRSTHNPERLDMRHRPETRLHGRWPLLARGAWLAVTSLILGLDIGAIPRYHTVLETVCAASVNCFSDQLTASNVQGLHAPGISVGTYAALIVALQVLQALIGIVLGALLFWRRSHEPMALLCAFMLVTFFGIAGTAQHEGLAPISLRWYAVVEFLDFLAQMFFGLFFSLFPSGRFVPRWTRWTALLYGVYYAWTIFTFHPGTFTSLPEALLFFSLALTLVVAQVHRYRHISTPIQRQQTKWVMFAISLVILGFIISVSTTSIFFPTGHSSSIVVQLIGSNVIGVLFLLIPFSIVISILRSRLWDIDVIINKTLVYGLLTALLAVIYAGLVFGLQALLGGLLHQTNAIALVVSTLAIVVLIGPLRRRIQAIIDRRFYRRKYDAARTLAAFSATLSTEVDLATLSEHLVTVVQETMQPTHASLWLRKDEQRRT
jgi:hypothetical protein